MSIILKFMKSIILMNSNTYKYGLYKILYMKKYIPVNIRPSL